MERTWTDRLRRGDTSAFDRVYEAYASRIFSFLLRLSGRRDAAEDLAQETWLKFAKAAPTMHEDTALGPFLFTIARNTFASHRRWAMLDVSRLAIFGAERPASFDVAPDVHHEQAHALARLDEALRQVPTASREILLLVGVEGMEQADVARVLGISYDALRQKLSRARAQLAERMARLSDRRTVGAQRNPDRGEPT